MSALAMVVLAGSGGAEQFGARVVEAARPSAVATPVWADAPPVGAIRGAAYVLPLTRCQPGPTHRRRATAA